MLSAVYLVYNQMILHLSIKSKQANIFYRLVNGKNLQQFSSKHITSTQDGLSSNTVLQILQESQPQVKLLHLDFKHDSYIKIVSSVLKYLNHEFLVESRFHGSINSK